MEIMIKIVNWNIGGAKYLKDTRDHREETKAKINNGLKTLIESHSPHVITLQEIVQYGKKEIDNKGFKKITAEDIVDIDKINKRIEVEKKQYCYHPFPLIDTEKVSSRSKWDDVIKDGGWDEDEKGKPVNVDDLYFAQGNAFLIRKDMAHFPVWDLSKSGNEKNRVCGGAHAIEKVHLDTGLYFGDRNTEPRAALVAHFILGPIGEKKLPLDIFVVNIHLTTLKREREGIPEIDMEASRMRRAQLDIIFYGIVSRYNKWKQGGYLARGKERQPKDWETFDRHPPLWILSGDFNLTPESTEYEMIKKMNFIDLIPIDKKGMGTKAKGVGKSPTLTLDYIFGGPKFIAFDHIIIEHKIKRNEVIFHDQVKSSDHYPMFAEMPFTVPGK